MINKLIKENKVKTIVTIDILYNVIKEAIKGTGIQQIIVNSVQDSFSFQTKCAYNMQVRGINLLYHSDWYQEKILLLKDKMPKLRETETDNYREEKLTAFEKKLIRFQSYI